MEASGGWIQATTDLRLSESGIWLFSKYWGPLWEASLGGGAEWPCVPLGAGGGVAREETNARAQHLGGEGGGRQGVHRPGTWKPELWRPHFASSNLQTSHFPAPSPTGLYTLKCNYNIYLIARCWEANDKIIWENCFTNCTLPIYVK